MLNKVEAGSDIAAIMAEVGRKAKAAAAPLAIAGTEQKNKALLAAADAILQSRDAILEANKIDLANAAASGMAASFVDRLTLDDKRIEGIAEGIRAIAALPDPVGAVIAEWDRPNGLHIERVRTPLGVIGVIYESRPNVTADAGALCLKAGNAVILRGGSDSAHSSAAIHKALVAGLEAGGLPADSIQIVPVTDRAAVGEMLKGLDGAIDVIVRAAAKASSHAFSRKRACRFSRIWKASAIFISTRPQISTWRARSRSTPRCDAQAFAARLKRCWWIARSPRHISCRSLKIWPPRVAKSVAAKR